MVAWNSNRYNEAQFFNVPKLKLGTEILESG